MPVQFTTQEIKRLIRTELPHIIKTDPEMQEWIFTITHAWYAEKTRTEERFERTEDRIERVLEELKRDREENQKKWEENQKKLDEQQKASNKKWEEHQKVIEEMLASIKRIELKHESSIGALGARWGLMSESAFRNGLKAILEASFGVTVERYEDFDYEGIVFGRPDQVELDVIIHNGEVILCELKSSISKPQMYAFWRKCQFYEVKHHCVVTRKIVISPMVEEKAQHIAQELQIEVYSFADDVRVKPGTPSTMQE